MTTITYDFNTQLAEGQAHERQLDEFFLTQYQGLLTIAQATPAQQRQGIDRLFTSTATGKVDTIEYKADSLAGKTGNAFIETVSVDTAHKPGWAVASTAQYLVYMVTEPQTIYLVLMARLRRELPKWKRQYPLKAAQNHGYKTYGLLVPLTELERIALYAW